MKRKERKRISIYLFANPIENNMGEFLWGDVDKAIEELGGGDDDHEAEAEAGDGGVLERPVLGAAQVHEKFDASGIDDGALDEIPT